MTDEPPQTQPDPKLAKLGVVLAVVGVLAILWGVLHVAEAARGDQPLAPEFAERRSYNQVKEAVHGSLAGGLMRSLAGFVLTVWGVRLFQRFRQPPGDPLEEMRRRQEAR